MPETLELRERVEPCQGRVRLDISERFSPCRWPGAGSGSPGSNDGPKAARAQRMFGQHFRHMVGLWGPDIEHDICQSLPTPDIPCFMEITIHP